MFQSVQFTSATGLGRTALAAFFLGFLMALHIALSLYCIDNENYVILSWSIYAIALCFFHFTEFLVTASYRPTIVSFESFILDHSQAYHLALFASCVEFWVEYSIFPYKRQGNEFQRNCLIGGFILLLFGQSCRTAAMISAASNFSHTIEFSKRDDHFLVTSGMYRFVRHPSYLGWFYWSIATQIVLLNPICFVLYIALSWGFFKDRIPYEEETLMVLFPKEYPEYKRRTVSGIPFI